MAGDVNEDDFHRRIGTGGKKAPMQVITHGVKRMEVSATHPAITMPAADTAPDAPAAMGSGTLFFRDNGAGKSQACLRFPSGAIQIIGTEP